MAYFSILVFWSLLTTILFPYLKAFLTKFSLKKKHFELFFWKYQVLKKKEWELGVVVQGSQSKGRGFESCLFQILHGNGVKAMPGSIPVNTQSWFTDTKKKTFKKKVLKKMMCQNLQSWITLDQRSIFSSHFWLIDKTKGFKAFF